MADSRKSKDSLDGHKTLPLPVTGQTLPLGTSLPSAPLDGRTLPVGPPIDSTLDLEVEPPSGAFAEPEAEESVSDRALGKSVELFVVDEALLPGSERRSWRAAEIWTKRRVYGLDATFKCIEILDRETGKPHTNHDLLGARLGGGRLRAKDTVRFSYPLPLPGMEAMFMKGPRHGYTSPVERMIVRIRVLHTASGEAMPTWDQIATRWSDPPPS